MVMIKMVSEKMKCLAANRGAFTTVKITLVSFNIFEIAFTCWIIYSGVSMLSEQEADPTITAKAKEVLSVNKTILIMSSVMAIILCLVGLIGALRESYGCVVSFAVVLGVLFLLTLVSPARTKILNLLLLLVMTLLASGYAMMIKVREKATATDPEDYMTA